MAIKRMSSSMPLTILVAEDNLVNQKMLLMMLSKLGYTDVIACKDGEEVLDAIEQYGCKHFDTILMDCS